MTDPRHGLVGTLALLAATVAALLTVALTRDEGAPAAAGDEATALDPQRLLELGIESTPRVARRVEAIRGLGFDRIPKPKISDLARLRGLAEREIAKPAVKRQLAVAEAELRLLGLVDPGQSLGEVATDVTASAVAYYDTRREELTLVGDAVPAGPELAEFVLAHELTHALEDQLFGLPESKGLTDDRALAESALVEGTATAVMVAYARRHLDPLALAAEASGLDEGGAGELPRFAEAEVKFAYSEGAEFVGELLDIGRAWALVDYAYEVRAPATTEQVLHADKYLNDERALEVATPRSPGGGWRTVDTGSLGEFGTREVLREAGVRSRTDGGAVGWGGDRYRLFVREGQRAACGHDCGASHALAVAWRGDSAREARELATALRLYVRRALGGVPQGKGTWLLETGTAAISLDADRVGLGLAPDPEIARRIASAR